MLIDFSCFIGGCKTFELRENPSCLCERYETAHLVIIYNPSLTNPPAIFLCSWTHIYIDLKCAYHKQHNLKTNYTHARKMLACFFRAVLVFVRFASKLRILFKMHIYINYKLFQNLTWALLKLLLFVCRLPSFIYVLANEWATHMCAHIYEMRKKEREKSRYTHKWFIEHNHTKTTTTTKYRNTIIYSTKKEIS